MKKLRIYLDTSVISHLDAPDVPDKEADTQRLWEDIKAGKYEVVISDLTLVEMRNCPEPKRSFMREAITKISSVHVDRSDESQHLSDLYVKIGGLPQRSRDDATHIGIATACGCDIILSWNFRHIVNFRAMKAVDVINIMEGYRLLKILSPSMLINEEE
jgi:predicted nucleic acid-binding protein